MHRARLVCFVCCLALVPRGGGAAQEQGALAGTVVDPLGAAVAGASVTLLRGDDEVAQAVSGAAGEFAFEGLAAGRYQVRADAPGFETRTTDPVFVGTAALVRLDVDLRIGPLQQEVVVTASASSQLQSQTGAPVTVIDAATLEALNKPDVLDALRLVPGSQVMQNGARGGATSVFVRGGNSNFNKVLIDGLPANDIGGGFDFSQVSATGLERIEVLRQSNSVVYGSDALSGVINLTTRRGRTRIPELAVTLAGGTLGTVNTAASIGGASGRFDYFSQLTHFETDNDVPNNGFRNRTYAGRFGAALGSGSDLSATIRRVDTASGNPNGILLFGIPDDARQDGGHTYVTVTSQSQWTDRWQTTLRFGVADSTSLFLDPAPTGEPFDPFGFGPNFLGDEVTLTAAGGQSVTGRAILNFGGTYPSAFLSRTTRRTVTGQTTYQARPGLALSFGARYEREAAFGDADADREADEDPIAARDNGGGFVEGRVSLARTYIGAGVGYERNDVFGSAVTPRVSVAVYLREPSPADPLGGTKLVFNAGTGIKAPAVFQEVDSLFALLSGTPAGAFVEPIGPERSRSVDAGIEQGLAAGRARVRVAYFDSDFHDLIEFVSRNVLPQVGVPADVAAATAFGAYVNSQSYRARGVEASLEAAPVDAVRVSGSYTFLDAEVTESFSSGALAPAINPAFPGVRIGAFSPLVGARPFRRPTHSGALMVAYTRGRALVSFSGYFAGARDDSTFLSDAFFGNALLLPNQDLAPAYQTYDVAAAYWIHPRLRASISVENVLDEDYTASFGFPSLPRTARVGVTVRIGGDR